ncbi:hypothetical protein DXG01_011497, partial [Tephrocybe rancida]
NAAMNQHDPEGSTSLSTMSDIRFQTANDAFSPFPNKNSFLLSNWYWNGGAQKSKTDFRRLLRIIGSDEFNPRDVAETAWDSLDRKLGINDWDREEWQVEDAGWTECSVKISVPFHRYLDNPGVRDYKVPGFYHRPLVAVIHEKLTTKKEDVAHFVLEPYKLLWRLKDGEEPLPLYGEMYSSTAFLQAHQDLQQSPPEPGCSLPRVVVALMFWSDATHLTQFGNAKITPLYLYFASTPPHSAHFRKPYADGFPSSLTQLPDVFKDFVTQYMGQKKINANLMTHCNRELVHKQWRTLLDDEFIQVHKHGIVVDWVGDGQPRRFYPRIMTYSADYPEK